MREQISLNRLGLSLETISQGFYIFFKLICDCEIFRRWLSVPLEDVYAAENCKENKENNIVQTSSQDNTLTIILSRKKNLA